MRAQQSYQTPESREGGKKDIDFDAAELAALEQYYLGEEARITLRLNTLEDKLTRGVHALEALETRFAEGLNALDALRTRLEQELTSYELTQGGGPETA